MKISFVLAGWQSNDLAFIKAAIPPLLEALVNINCEELKRDPSIPPLYLAGVRYKREPYGQEDWQDIRESLKRKTADCEDLACWRVAELRVRHQVKARPWVRGQWRPAGYDNAGNFRPAHWLFHILVKLPNGQLEDPSRRLGM